MKKNILLAGLVLILANFSFAQTTNYRVVFDMTSSDSVNQQSLIRQLTGIRKSDPSSQLEVVVYSHGLDFVLKGKTSQEPAIVQLLADKNVSFKVCEATMKRRNIDKTQLIAGVEIVPDGIYEIVTKQQAGWGYIKVAH
jgi:intracellular sulfur oxidation DsrE/DsrF family protein